MRYLIKFTKGSHIKFISHLDLMRTIQRVVRRSNLKVLYSQGFNPHMDISLCQPLSVGVYSSSEYLDIYLDEEISGEEIIKKLNGSSNNQIKFLSLVKIEGNLKSSMAMLTAASYSIIIKYDNSDKLEEELKGIWEREIWNILKKSKNSEKEVNIKELIYKINYSIEESGLYIKTIIACGSKENLSPELLSKYIIESTSGYKKDSFVNIQRDEMFASKDGNLVPLDKYCALNGAN